MRYERFWINAVFLTAVACSRETPAPPPIPAKPAAPPTVTTTTAAAPIPAAADDSYDDAILWLRSAPAFRFEIDEAGVHATGDLKRGRIGSESMRLRANGEEWRASASPRGVAWERRNGNAWIAAPAPSYGNRIYQRLTLAFDPQKKEGTAQLVEPGHYQFTDANSGLAHEVWVRDGRVVRMTVGRDVELKIEN
jgi:hypothetical protein